MSAAEEAAGVVRRRAGSEPVGAAIVLGTGLGGFADAASDSVEVSYGDLPGFPAPGVSGHAGRLVVGRIGGLRVALFEGREHYYEHGDAAAMRVPLETASALGASVLVLTNAAGSIRADAGPGSVMLISDHIAFAGANPLIGESGDARFVDLSLAYDEDLRARLRAVASARAMSLAEGVYVWFSGPSFETPAEIRAARILGGDAVGMSTVPEVIIARRLGLRVAALSLITNAAAGLGPPLDHAQTRRVASGGAARVGLLLTGLMESLANAAHA